MKCAMITGITGQDGAYLARLLLEKGYTVYGILSPNRGSSLNGLKRLAIEQKIHLLTMDLLDGSEVERVIQEVHPEEIYNFAAQSSVGKSFQQPQETLLFNTQSIVHLLEAVKNVDRNIRIYQASSSEMFGNVATLSANEDTPLNPGSPYAISKAAAHWMVGNYRENYGLFAVSGILFNHESPLRSPGFFVKKVIRDSIAISRGEKEFLEVGNINVRRDFGYGPAYVEAMWRMLQTDTPRDYVICSGTSILLKDIIYYVFEYLDIPQDRLLVNQEFFRLNEIEDMYGDSSRAKRELGWKYDLSFYQVLDILIEEELKYEFGERMNEAKDDCN